MTPSKRIDKEIADLADWRGQTLANLRRIIHDADPEVIEEWKWMGTGEAPAARPLEVADGLTSPATLPSAA